MSRFFHARTWSRAALFLTVACIATLQGVPAATAHQDRARRDQQEQRQRDPEERVAGGEEAEGGEPAAHGPTALMLTPTRLETSVGSIIRLSLSVLGSRDLRRLPVTVRFDPRVVEVVSVKLGNAWNDRSEPVLLYDSSRPGELVIGLALLNRDEVGVSGTAELLELEFRAIGRGNASLILDRFAAISAGSNADELTPITAEVIVR